MTDNDARQPTDPKELERQIMDSNVPKNEREWWARDEIERVREAMTNCCHFQPRPGIGTGDDNVFPEQMPVLERVADGLNYRTPVQDLIVKMKHMASCGDMRPQWGASIARCLLHNGAERLNLLANKIDVRPWRTMRQRFADAWAVFRGQACAIYVNGSVYDRGTSQ